MVLTWQNDCMETIHAENAGYGRRNRGCHICSGSCGGGISGSYAAVAEKKGLPPVLTSQQFLFILTGVKFKITQGGQVR